MVPTGSGQQRLLPLSTWCQSSPPFAALFSSDRASSETRIASSALKHPAVFGRMMYLSRSRNRAASGPAGQPALRAGDGDDLATRRIQCPLHDFVRAYLPVPMNRRLPMSVLMKESKPLFYTTRQPATIHPQSPYYGEVVATAYVV
jgi:hypothetical protein